MENFKQNPQKLIEDFINTQPSGHKLDERTQKAYRLDLEHFYRWVNENSNYDFGADNHNRWETNIEAYLKHLSIEKGLRPSTVVRKYRVFSYYLSYLNRQGILVDYRPLKLHKIAQQIKEVDDQLSKKEIDAFFQALNREYGELDNDFRKRICLRDLVMMKLLFYHGIQVSELLQLRISDYDFRKGILLIRRKRGQEEKIDLFSGVLREQMNTWLKEHKYFERNSEYCDYMFLSKIGKTLSMKMVINIFDKYRIMAGIKKQVTPKDLKNSMERYAKELMIEQQS